MKDEIIFFAKTNFRNKEHVFGIKQDDRRRHMYVIGKTGMGKTNLIQNMAIQDVRSGRGVAVVDPHGEFAEECLKAVPTNRINDVIYFNPADTAYPIAMNVMEKVDPEYRHLIASGLVGVFKKIWADSWGPRLEYLLRNAILALLEYPTSTLLGVTKILIDKDYRAKVMEKVTDPVVKSFWTEEFTKYHDRLMADAIAPIQNKVGQFLSSSLIRNIVGQVKSSFDIRQAMDNQKIIIMNLSKGRIGEDNSALLGAMMITKIQLAAMARVDTPEKERKDFYLYVDEFQNFATESFANILSEARKYRLNLILVHQYITQLDEKVQNAVFGNIGTLVTFRVGAADAEFLEKEFSPVFYMTDLVNLAKYNIYLKLMIDGIAASPFSASALPPIDINDTVGNYEKIIRVSAERYGTPRKIVEEKINRWSGIMNPEAKEKLSKIVREQTSGQRSYDPIFQDVKQAADKVVRTKRTKDRKDDRNSEKPAIDVHAKYRKRNSANTDDSRTDRLEYDAECSVCSAKIKVPFKPDGTRPVFCKECLREYRREQMKIQSQMKNSETQLLLNSQKRYGKKQPKGQESKKELRDLINQAIKQREE